MVDVGFKVGQASPCTFEHERNEIMCFVHGDDFVASEEHNSIVWMKEQMEVKYKITTTIIGEDPELAKEGRILNRIIRWYPGRGVSYEADPRHVEAIMKATGAEEMRSVRTPLVKESAAEECTDAPWKEREADIERRKKEGS